MKLQVLALFALGVVGVRSEAGDVAADFEKACQGSRQDCIDNSEDMSLIQMKVEVDGDGDDDATETTKKEGDDDDDESEEEGGEEVKEGKHKKGQTVYKVMYEDSTQKERDCVAAKCDCEVADVKCNTTFQYKVDHKDCDGGPKKCNAEQCCQAMERIVERPQVHIKEETVEVPETKVMEVVHMVPEIEGWYETKQVHKPTCPTGFIAKTGQIPPYASFGKAPSEIVSLSACAEYCNNRTTCHSFEFSESSSPSCLMNTRYNPTSRMENPNYMFCTKGHECRLVVPWKDWDNKLSLDSNLRNSWTVLHSCFYETFVIWMATWIIWLILSMLIMKTLCGAPECFCADVQDPVDVLQYGHFDCTRRPQICICSLLCPAAQWAATINLADFMSAPGALMVYALCAFLNGIVSLRNTEFGGEKALDAETKSYTMTQDGKIFQAPPGTAAEAGSDPKALAKDFMMFFEGGTFFFMVGFFTAILIVFFRQKLRQKLNLRHTTCSTLFFDFLYVFFCPCCAVAQEALVVQNAYCMPQCAEEKKNPKIKNIMQDHRVMVPAMVVPEVQETYVSAMVVPEVQQVNVPARVTTESQRVDVSAAVDMGRSSERGLVIPEVQRVEVPVRVEPRTQESGPASRYM